MSIQKTAGSLLCLLLWAQTTVLRAQTTGVGINTENLQGAFQVDAAANNPASGLVPAAQQADDVVVTEEGYTGIGTLTPSTQLHIHTRNQTGVFPLRLTDGTEGNNKMLTSDDEGSASWQTPPTPPSSTVYPLQTGTVNQPFPTGSETQVGNSSFTVPEDGFYSVDLRFWAEGITNNSHVLSTPIQTITRFQLWRNGDKVDEYQYNEPSYTRVTLFVTLYASASQGDVLSLYVYPVLGFPISGNGYTHDLSSLSTYEWTKIKILYKKLGVDDNTHYFDNY
jgi:hypothetical protein